MKKFFKWFGFCVLVFVLFMSLTNHPTQYHTLGVVEALDTLNTTFVVAFLYFVFKDFLAYIKKSK